MEAEQGRGVSFAEAAIGWYDQVYLVQTGVLHQRGMLRDLPGRTETDLYLWLCEHRAALEEALGWEVDLDLAAADLARQLRPRPQRLLARAREKLQAAVIPSRLQAGPPPGAWRRERRAKPEDDCLFGDVLVWISDPERGWPAVAQAAEIACREGAELQGLLVVASKAERAGERVQVVEAEFARQAGALGVKGRLSVDVGRAVPQVCERSRWTDLIVLSLDSGPASQRPARLSAEFNAMLRRCATPVLVVPGASSPLSRPIAAFDGGPKAWEALFVAAYLALRGQVPLTVVSVGEDSLDAPAALAQAREYLAGHGVEATYVQKEGPVAAAILETAAAYDSDLILMGGYGRLPVVEMVLGSAVDQVLQRTRQPVLVCR
jgi:nucleotide-binding universal stress UspA family protein